MYGHRNTTVASPVALLQTGVCNLQEDEPIEDPDEQGRHRADDDRADAGDDSDNNGPDAQE
jgi:hypothetical protein